MNNGKSFEDRVKALQQYASRVDNRKNTKGMTEFINANFTPEEMSKIADYKLGTEVLKDSNGYEYVTNAYGINATGQKTSRNQRRYNQMINDAISQAVSSNIGYTKTISDALKYNNPTVITPDSTTAYDQATNTQTTTLSPDKQALRASQIDVAQLLKDSILNQELNNQYSSLYNDVSAFALNPYQASQPQADSIYQAYVKSFQPTWDAENQAFNQQMTSTGLNGASEAAQKVFIANQRRRTEQMLGAKTSADNQAMSNIFQAFQLRGDTLGKKANNTYNQISGMQNYASPQLGLSQLMPYNSVNLLGYDTANQDRMQQNAQFNKNASLAQNSTQAQNAATIGRLGADTAMLIFEKQ